MTEHDSMLFVGIKEPAEVRKNLLESSKSIIHSLQNYEKIRLLREDKAKEIANIRSMIKEIGLLLGKLRNTLPKTGLQPLTEGDEEKLRKKEEEAIEKIEEVRLKSEEKEDERLYRMEIEDLKAKKKKHAKKKTRKKPEKKIVQKEINELQRLEEELKRIEGKLENL